MRDDILTLISQTREKDDYGRDKIAESTTDVLCRVKSASMTEFFEGGRNGLNPVYQFTIPRVEYNGERIIEYAGQRYTVYRVYESGLDDVELYVEQRGGSNAS